MISTTIVVVFITILITVSAIAAYLDFKCDNPVAAAVFILMLAAFLLGVIFLKKIV